MAAAEGRGEYNKHELLGSRSYLYVDIEAALLIPQLDITTQKQAHQQIVLLQHVIRNLKKFFNGKFCELFREKEEIFGKIETLNARLKAVINELRSVSKTILLKKVSLNWQCHNIFRHFFHESNPPGPLIKWLCWKISFREF